MEIVEQGHVMTAAILKIFPVMAIVLFVTTPAVGAPKPIAHRAAACALGAQVMVEQAGRGVSIFDGMQTYPADYFKNGALNERWPLSKAHRRLLAKARPENLFGRCPELMRQLPPGARMATAEDRLKVQQLGPHRLYVGTLLAPLVAPDGRSALMFEFMRCVGLCGDGSLHVYRRVNGAWVKGEAILRMIS